jgi:hypothetical protein
MDKAPVDLVSPEWVDSLIAAALGGAPAAPIAALVDQAVIAKMIDSSKLGVSFGLGADEAPDVWVADRGEVERVRGVAYKQWPAVKAFVDKRPKLDHVFCTDGKRLRVFAVERDNVAGQGGHPVLAWEWIDGAEGVVTRHEAPPLSLLSPALATRVEAFAPRVRSGLWGVHWRDGVVTGLSWSSEGVSSPAIAAAFVELGHGTRFKTAYQVYSASGLGVHPWFAEFHADGGGRVCMWGALRTQDTSHLPAIFAEGAVPDAAVFARELATVVAPADQAAATALVRDELIPIFTRLRPAEKDEGRHLAEVWTWIVGLLGLELPTDRLALLQRVTVSARLAELQGSAFHLAAARYLASHPDAAPPADLPSALVGASAEDIAAQAAALRATFDTLEAAASADPELDLHRYPYPPYDLPTTKTLLEQAVAGEFQAASGPLHDYLEGLGRLGYDDDPSLITIDSVDLDQGSQDAVLEEALAAKEDDKA